MIFILTLDIYYSDASMGIDDSIYRNVFLSDIMNHVPLLQVADFRHTQVVMYYRSLISADNINKNVTFIHHIL